MTYQMRQRDSFIFLGILQGLQGGVGVAGLSCPFLRTQGTTIKQVSQCPPLNNLSPWSSYRHTAVALPKDPSRSRSSLSLPPTRPCAAHTYMHALIPSTEPPLQVGLFIHEAPVWRDWVIWPWGGWEETSPGGSRQYLWPSAQLPRFPSFPFWALPLSSWPP